ncbi:hypothetical protein QA641_06090 [Bradyrhizobium sp. CB1650]|uniref:hypothetical protein n=1 Tax=Bradyrhizobium sp. CB1650 TaxID=3039153 RepID=UPI0024348408|nr:hypothetical protein [Bradyrhizobium sp. CB1650]WGD53484.1 hypothetical protein QA641_06090 [Bradyrhizobium sp. CB1650]
MIDVKKIVGTIEKLLAEDTPQSITYAALECRLAIEKICYDRLRIAHDYISPHDLRRYRPGDVVKTLLAEVDGNTASNLTISISRQPSDTYKIPIDQISDTEWVQIGAQAGFDPKKLGNYWQSLSNLALHVRLPKSKDDGIPEYGDAARIRKHVTEVLDELKRIAIGTLLTTGIGEEVSFECECARANRRRSGLLRNGQIVSCVGVDCNESFDVSIENNEFYFVRRVIRFPCQCGEQLAIPTRIAENLKRDQFLDVECLKCRERTRLMWRLMRKQPEAQSSAGQAQSGPIDAR